MRGSRSRVDAGTQRTLVQADSKDDRDHFHSSRLFYRFERFDPRCLEEWGGVF